MIQFGREYRFSAGQAGGDGFEIGETTTGSPKALHISFSIEKADTETPNTAIISLWNLNPEHLAILNEPDCIVTLRAGYGSHMPLIFVGAITYIETSLDGGDRETRIEAADGRVELRDCYVSLSYAGTISTNKIIEDIAADMGVAVSFSYNVRFAELPNGFAFVGNGRTALDKACASSGLDWQIYNGVLQVKLRGDTMTREVYLLSPDSGLIGIPKKITFGSTAQADGDESGYECEFLLNGAVGIGDYIRVESKVVTGYFRIRSLSMDGDNESGSWLSKAKLIEA